MNVAQLQLALGRLTSPAAAEKPDLAGYEAQGEFWAGSGESRFPGAQAWAGRQGCDRRATLGAGGLADIGAWAALGPMATLNPPRVITPWYHSRAARGEVGPSWSSLAAPNHAEDSL